jgi:ubiquinone/menaquinone biosynthesis C-methylase UbiE
MAVQSNFSDSDAYERQMGRWSRHLAEPFLDFAGINDGERILDAGCGTGSLTFAIAKRCNPLLVRGVDTAKPFIDAATARNFNGQIEFQIGDVCALPFPPSSFDRVLSLLVLHFVPDTQKALAEFRRVARPGAIIAAAVWDARGGFVAQRLFYDTAAMIDADGNEARARQFTRPLCQPDELENAWRKAGFVDVVGTTVMTRMTFECFEDYWTPYLGKQAGAASYVASLSDERREILKEAVRFAYLDGAIDGPRSYAAIAWAVKGAVPQD